VKPVIPEKNGDAPLPGEIFKILPESVQQLVQVIPSRELKELEEIRLRAGRPLMVRVGQEDAYLGEGGLTANWAQGHTVSTREVEQVLELLTKSSLYALQEELRNGYLTLPGGHRVGLVGEAVVEKSELKTMKHIQSLNIRLARQVAGCARALLPMVVSGGRVLSSLLISPPRCGKTTILRDLIRQLSSGVPELKLKGLNIGVVDERSELAGCYHGVPQTDLGPRSDVLDKCPKALGMIILLRSMSPQVIATDELGRMEDALAVQEILNAGVSILATVHGSNLEEIKGRPAMRQIAAAGVFERYIILGRSRGPGTVEKILDGRGQPLASRSGWNNDRL